MNIIRVTRISKDRLEQLTKLGYIVIITSPPKVTPPRLTLVK